MPKSKIIGSAPILLVKDVIASANYYRDKVGFNYDRFWGEPPEFCILYRDGFHLMLKQVEDEKYVVPHYKAAKDMWNIYFWVDAADELYEELINLGAKIDYELCDQPYGCREFGIQDLDGYDIAFGQEIGTTLLCEPSGSRIEPPGDGGAVLHGIDQAPDLLDDGLPVSTLLEEGIDPKPIGDMLAAIRDGEYTKLDSVLIARNGKLILESYFNGYDRDTMHDMRSAFKSVTSALAGIAIDKGLILDPDRPISDYFPDYWSHIQGDLALKNRISLTHLLTMTSGFNAEEVFGIGPNREDDMFRSQDWVTFTLGLSMAREPGTSFSYNSSTTFLIGEIVARASGEPLPQFAKKYLFEPLGISHYCWTLTPKQRAVAQGNFYIRPRDMIKIGQLFLNNGSWYERRIISTRWIENSTRHHVDQRHEQPGNQPHRNGYGFQWWTWRAHNSLFDYYSASGNGGQKIYVFPRINIVVVFTGSHYNRAIGHRQPTEIIDRYLVPAVPHQ
jgi:CubicO group peptidase (beta-lactamase class C family)